jgi:hypothetical protein
MKYEHEFDRCITYIDRRTEVVCVVCSASIGSVMSSDVLTDEQEEKQHRTSNDVRRLIVARVLRV